VAWIADNLHFLLFGGACLLLLAGFPVAFTLAGSGLLFAGIGLALDVFDPAFLNAFPHRIFGTMNNQLLIAVPLFIFMGVMLERSRVAEELLESMGRLFGSIRGGLGISVSVVGALLAASTGIVGATVVTMGLLSLPSMLRQGYDARLACGSIAAAGTLGQIIPPSIVLVLLGDVLSSAYQQAQLAQGNFSPDTMSVGDLFAGALLPGLALVGLYILYQAAMALFRPESSPLPAKADDDASPRPGLADLFHALIAPLALIIAVLGSILTGVATSTEAASVGAIGALLLAGYRLDSRRPAPIYAAIGALIGLIVLTNMVDIRLNRPDASILERLGQIIAAIATLVVAAGIAIALGRVWRGKILRPVIEATTRITTMVFGILIGAALFSLVFRGLGGDVAVTDFLTALPGGKVAALFAVMAVMFLLGFFLDFIEIVFVVVPIVAPALLMMDISPVWLGVMMAMNLQTSFLTPPFGFALFYLRGVAPDSIPTSTIYRGALPFVAIQLVALLALAEFPRMATWLPGILFAD